MVIHMADSSIAVVLLDTDPYHAIAPLIKIALSQFCEGDHTKNMSQELSEKLHRLGPCQKLLTTKSDLTMITTWDLQCTGSITQTVPFFSGL